jgi:hypothetical protein
MKDGDYKEQQGILHVLAYSTGMSEPCPRTATTMSMTHGDLVLENTDQASTLRFQCDCNSESQNIFFCDVCSKIDFDKLFNRKTFPQRPEAICNLKHIMKSNCPLCIFLRNCCPGEDLNEDRLSRYWFVLGRASPIFGTHKLNKTLALQIHFRS